MVAVLSETSKSFVSSFNKTKEPVIFLSVKLYLVNERSVEL